MGGRNEKGSILSDCWILGCNNNNNNLNDSDDKSDIIVDNNKIMNNKNNDIINDKNLVEVAEEKIEEKIGEKEVVKEVVKEDAVIGVNICELNLAAADQIWQKKTENKVENDNNTDNTKNNNDKNTNERKDVSTDDALTWNLLRTLELPSPVNPPKP